MPHDTMKHDDSAAGETTPERLICDAVLAIKTLDQARREGCGEYNERTRKLRETIESLQNARLSSAHELFDLAATLTPEIRQIIANPTHGL